jgi:N4-gp56 family major capsid protein
MKNIINLFSLQLFAEAGTTVMTTTGTANAYTGAVSTTEAMSPTLKTFYDTELLENARVEMFYGQFGQKQPLPAGRGKTVEWRKWNTFGKASKLVEGVIPDSQTFGQSTITDTIEQYGTFASISDQLDLHAYDPVILGATEEMGASMAETQETLIRNALLTGGNVMYCDNIKLEDGSVVGTPTVPGEMEASATVMSILTPKMVNKVVTYFKKNRVPRINGKYYCVIHPSVAEDLRNSEAWIEVHKYAAASEIFNGEIGELHGMRFIENPFAPVLDGEYVNKAGTKTYASFCFGKDAFGIIDPEGGAARMIVKPASEVGGPLEQFSTVGYKLETNGAKVLYTERLVRLMSCSSYSGSDDATDNDYN